MQCSKCGQVFDPAKQRNWGPFDCSYHPRHPRSIGNTGPRGDYAELWYFPCCGQGVVGQIVNGEERPVSRTPGCVNGFHERERRRIFLSYAHSDGLFAGFLENELKRRGYAVWRDATEIRAGENWHQAIDAALNGSSHFIILLSPQSVERPQVNLELGVALHERKPIIPILLEDCALPSQLSAINYIDWRKDQDFNYSPNFSLLDEALDAPHRAELLEQLRREERDLPCCPYPKSRGNLLARLPFHLAAAFQGGRHPLMQLSAPVPPLARLRAGETS